jgi:predicted lipid-binding transport protein (Tim44 family)
MRTILLAAAATGFAVSSAYAGCDYHSTVSADSVDQTKVASVAISPQSDAVVPTDEASPPPATDIE